ncbi:MAG: 50S ribosomal protein L29 [Candidatus Omnitrophica bacterium]|nr:50S ribosomal protein L29 [Candidatus Omnitrophota bacterium]
MAIKSKEYKDYQKPELDEKLKQLEEELFNLKFQAKTSKLDKPHKIKLVRRDIARVKTFLRQLQAKEQSE